MTGSKPETSFKPAPPSADENTKVNQIQEFTSGVCTAEQALRVLRRNGGNLEKAITAILDEGPGGDDVVPMATETDCTEVALRQAAAGVVQPRSPPRTLCTGCYMKLELTIGEPASRPERPDIPTIDIPGDDEAEQLKRALAASLEDSGPTFGPSDRAPDPSWAVVPSNVRYHRIFAYSESNV
jgi:hypothetical protein